jgi:hypothetical protein
MVASGATLDEDPTIRFNGTAVRIPYHDSAQQLLAL